MLRQIVLAACLVAWIRADTASVTTNDYEATAAYWKNANNINSVEPPVLPGFQQGAEPYSCPYKKLCERRHVCRTSEPSGTSSTSFKLSDVPEKQMPNVIFTEMNKALPIPVPSRPYEAVGTLYARDSRGKPIKCMASLVNINDKFNEPPIIVAIAPAHCVFNWNDGCRRNEAFEFRAKGYVWNVKKVHHKPANLLCGRNFAKQWDYAVFELVNSPKACVPDWDKAKLSFYGGPSPCPPAFGVGVKTDFAPEDVYAMAMNEGKLVGSRVRGNCFDGVFFRTAGNPFGGPHLGGPMITEDFVLVGMNTFDAEGVAPYNRVWSPKFDGHFRWVLGQARSSINAERAKLPKEVETSSLSNLIDREATSKILCGGTNGGGLLSGLVPNNQNGAGGLGSIFSSILCGQSRR